MIAALHGTVLHAGLDHVVVEVGGVGLRVLTTPATAGACRTGSAVRLATTLIVREESLTLYGFEEPAERDLFEQVQTVSGVGPRLALAMLAVHAPDALRSAIAGSDLPALVKIPGIGKKSAERIVLELKDKVGPVAAGGAAPAPTAVVSSQHEQVVEALVGLGWSAKQAQDAVTTVAGADPDTSDVSALLRAALRELGR